MPKHNLQLRQTYRVRVGGLSSPKEWGTDKCLVATVSDRLFRNEEVYET